MALGIGSWMRGLLVAALAATSLGAAAQSRDGLRVQLSAPQLVLRGDVDVTVTVTVTNTGRQPAHVLRWQLPQESAEGPLFRIVREDGVAVRYTGMRIKRAGPDASDFVKIEAGATASWDVELTSSYDLATNGRFTIQYQGRAGHGPRAADLSSEPLHLWLEGRTERKTAATAVPGPQAAALTTANCSATQQSTITTALANAVTMATNASGYLNAGTAGPRYTTWFGAYNAGRYATVRTNFANIKSALETQPVTVDCGCKQKRTYAYVYANQPYKIWVCGAFWSAPMTGTDSKAGTLIHEMSHFTVVAGTDDWAYGQTNAKNLALTDPAKAIDNADSHEYFAENTPALN